MKRAPEQEPLKLALVSPYDFAYPGGVTEHVVHLGEQLLGRGHRVHIVAPSSDDEAEPEVGAGMVVHRIGRVVRIPANGSVARITLSLRAYMQAKRLLQEEQYDLIHLHEPMMPALPLTVLRHSHTTNVGTFHAFRNKPLAYFYGKPILQPFFRKLHGHIAVSTVAREFVGEYFPTDYEIIPNGIDYRRFNERKPPLERFRDGRPNVLFVGRLEKRKGLRFLLRAWPLITAEFPRARLIVVGGGRPLEGYRRFAARRGWNEDDVCFAGHVPTEELPRYYQAAHVYCAPSTGQESFGIVLLEAMAAGAAIVASDIPGYRTVMTNGQEGLTVPPQDPRAIAASVCALLQNSSLRARMGEIGQRTAIDYDWSAIADKVEAYYGEVLARRAAETVRPARLSRMRRMAGLLSAYG